jgi:hypothetical protein
MTVLFAFLFLKKAISGRNSKASINLIKRPMRPPRKKVSIIEKINAKAG